jgi:hypothetical protein
MNINTSQNYFVLVTRKGFFFCVVVVSFHFGI